MKLKELLTKLERLKERKGDEIEVRLGEYGGRSSSIDSAYFDEDNNIIIIF